MSNKKYYKIFECCFLTKGHTRSMLFDSQRQSFELIPNEIFELISIHFEKMSTIEIKNNYSSKDWDIVSEYINYFIENEYIFICDENEKDFFPSVKLKWDFPAIITNCIIDLNSNFNQQSFDIFSEIADLGCENIQIRCFDLIPLDFFKKLFKKIEKTNIYGIELILKFDESISFDTYLDFMNYPRLNSVVIHSSPFNKKENLLTDQSLIYTQQIINGENCCGKINPKDFSKHLLHFTESQKHNTCLNRKISIDSDGEIKNCPSMVKSYGNIKSTSLKKVTEINDFKNFWYIHKDQIEVCKDCEFRHICTDCRAYIKDSNNIYSKPLKCTYDPYNATWGDRTSFANPLYGK